MNAHQRRIRRRHPTALPATEIERIRVAKWRLTASQAQSRCEELLALYERREDASVPDDGWLTLMAFSGTRLPIEDEGT